jgi:hypothetical protein
MDTLSEMFTRGVEELLGRASGPLHFRLFIMPIVVTVLAIRAHLRDVREGRSTKVGAFFNDPVERRRLVRSGLKDFGKVFLVACVLDTTYQLVFLRAFFPVQLLIVAVMSAIVPYALIRGPVTRLVRLAYQKWAGPSASSAANPDQDTKARPDH